MPYFSYGFFSSQHSFKSGCKITYSSVCRVPLALYAKDISSFNLLIIPLFIHLNITANIYCTGIS